MGNHPPESDWKIFRKMVPALRERYLGNLHPELIAILRDTSSTPTERFWRVEERVRKEAKILQRCLDGHSRSRMLEYMAAMYHHRMLSIADLQAFTEETRGRVMGLAAPPDPGSDQEE